MTTIPFYTSSLSKHDQNHFWTDYTNIRTTLYRFFLVLCLIGAMLPAATGAKAVPVLPASMPVHFPLIFSTLNSNSNAYTAFGAGGSYIFEHDAVQVNLSPEAKVAIHFQNISPQAALVPMDRKLATLSRYLGNDPSQWKAGIPTYKGVTYQSLYPGIDLAYEGSQGSLKGTYTVAAGVDPQRIQWRYEGSNDVRTRCK